MHGPSRLFGASVRSFTPEVSLVINEVRINTSTWHEPSDWVTSSIQPRRVLLQLPQLSDHQLQ